jgi:hypothetical protein
MSIRVERLSVSARHKSYSQLIPSFVICSSTSHAVGEKWRKKFSTTNPKIMPTNLDGALERKRKAAQAEARTNKTFLAFVIFSLALLVLLIFY